LEYAVVITKHSVCLLTALHETAKLVGRPTLRQFVCLK